MRLILFILLSVLCYEIQAKTPGFQAKKFYAGYTFSISPIPSSISRIPLYMTHKVNLDYVIKPFSSVGLRYTYTGAPVPGLNTHSLILIYKLHSKNKGLKAPLGRYYSFGIGYQHIQYGGRIYSQGQESTIPLNRLSDVVFHIGYGRNFIYAKRIILNPSIGVNLPVRSLFGNEDSSIGWYNFVSQIIHVNIGLSFLLF